MLKDLVSPFSTLNKAIAGSSETCTPAYKTTRRRVSRDPKLKTHFPGKMKY